MLLLGLRTTSHLEMVHDLKAYMSTIATATHWNTARQILGQNFLGVPKNSTGFGIRLTDDCWAKLSNIPFSVDTLTRSGNTHILAMDTGESLYKMRYVLGHGNLFHPTCAAWNPIPDSNKATASFHQAETSPQWHLLERTPPERLQCRFSARTLVYIAIRYYLEYGEWVFGNLPILTTDFQDKGRIGIYFYQNQIGVYRVSP